MRGRSLVPAGLAIALVVLAAGGPGCAYDWTYPQPSADNPRDGGDAPPRPGRCESTAMCASGEYCVFGDGRCAHGEPMGACVALPETCPEESPVCGCDGTAGETRCGLSRRGIDVDMSGDACRSRKDAPFACQDVTCIRNVEVCIIDRTRGGRCEAPTACSSATCGCVVLPARDCSCDDQSEPGAVRVSCP